MKNRVLYMKKTRIIILLLFFIGISFIGFISCDRKTTSDNLIYDSDGLEAPRERILYEITRLMDPATGKIPAGIVKRELDFARHLPKDQDYLRNHSATWMNRGPYYVGGRTRAFAVDVDNENILLAGAVSGGMWRSTDQGKSWIKITPADQLLSVSCITQDKRIGKTNTWYYGTGESYGNSASASGAYFYGNGIWKSTDNGLTWNILPATSSGKVTEYDIWDAVVEYSY
jgi:hypothetical protein